MKTETCLEIQAYVDGELSPSRRTAVERLCSADAAAGRLLRELTAIRECVHGHEPEIKVPESREFYFNQIQRRIQAAEPRASLAAPSAWVSWIRWLIPVAGVAAVIALVAIPRGTESPSRSIASISPATLDGATATSVLYRSDSDGVTVHWIN